MGNVKAEATIYTLAVSLMEADADTHRNTMVNIENKALVVTLAGTLTKEEALYKHVNDVRA